MECVSVAGRGPVRVRLMKVFIVNESLNSLIQVSGVFTVSEDEGFLCVDVLGHSERLAPTLLEDDFEGLHGFEFIWVHASGVGEPDAHWRGRVHVVACERDSLGILHLEDVQDTGNSLKKFHGLDRATLAIELRYPHWDVGGHVGVGGDKGKVGSRKMDGFGIGRSMPPILVVITATNLSVGRSLRPWRLD